VSRGLLEIWYGLTHSLICLVRCSFLENPLPLQPMVHQLFFCTTRLLIFRSPSTGFFDALVREVVGCGRVVARCSLWSAVDFRCPCARSICWRGLTSPASNGEGPPWLESVMTLSLGAGRARCSENCNGLLSSTAHINVPSNPLEGDGPETE
jgi:hypothetical protein